MKTKKLKIPVIRLLRTVTQIIFFILLPALYISAFSGIKQIYLSIYNSNFSVSAMLPQVIEAITIIPVTILAGRFFCGWMCAFGAMGDFIYMISQKLFKTKFKINEKVDRILKYVKYIVLLFLITAVWSIGIDTFSTASPWDAFGMLLTVGKAPDFAYVISNLLPALIVLVFIIAASFFVERFFCRYLCPLGAVFAIVSKLRIAKISKPKEKCGNCRICTRSCPMGIALYKKDESKSGECISCFECVSACPRKNVSLTISENDVRPVLASTMAVAVMTGVYYAGSFAVNAVDINITSIAQSNGSTASNKIYNNGTYEGSGTGFRGETTTVSVTVKNDTISDITLVSTGDDMPFFNRAFPTVVQSIVNNQSTDVDAVSGATYSSDGIMEAVANALDNAKIAQSAAVTTSSQVKTAETTSTTTVSVPATSASKVPSITAPAATSTLSTTPAPVTTATTTSATAVSSSSGYKDGTYEGSGTGFHRGTTTVSVTVTNGQISDVTTVSTRDDMPYYNRAFSSVVDSILSSQSTDVDAVSGATFSSNGIMGAVADALSQAKA